MHAIKYAGKMGKGRCKGIRGGGGERGEVSIGESALGFED
jgi:hypothetical protein